MLRLFMLPLLILPLCESCIIFFAPLVSVPSYLPAYDGLVLANGFSNKFNRKLLLMQFLNCVSLQLRCEDGLRLSIVYASITLHSACTIFALRLNDPCKSCICLLNLGLKCRAVIWQPYIFIFLHRNPRVFWEIYSTTHSPTVMVSRAN